ncbi:MAG: hypothetical protein COB85_09480, partial [Bacteroidetes bacterium]
NSGMDEMASNDTAFMEFHFMLANSVDLTLTLEDFPIANLLAWSIHDGGGNLIDSLDGYEKNTINIESNCLEEGCYIFKLYDVAGTAEGSFSLVDVLGDTLVAVNDLLDFTYTFCVSTTGVNERKAFNPPFSLFPNPTNGKLVIHFKSTVKSNVNLRVFSARGDVCIDRRVGSGELNSLELNLTGKASGLYFVQITDENGTYTKKFSLLR